MGRVSMKPILNCDLDNFEIFLCERDPNNTYITTNSTVVSEGSYLLCLWSVLICICILFSCCMTLYGRGIVGCIKKKTYIDDGYHDML